MKSTPRLYDTLIGMLGQHKHWRDKRHFQTLAWIVVGLLESGLISLTAWAPFVEGRALFAQSIVRRFRRWLDNERIPVHEYYAPLIREALSDWGKQVLYLALDTSQLWGRFCIIRLSLIYRGRAVPLVWRVIAHGSSSVAFETYRLLLEQAQVLIPPGCQVVFLADRGFADTELMAYLRDSLHWHWRIRIKSSFLVYRPGQRRIKISSISLKRGQAHFWHAVYITADQFGPVHLALAKPHGLQEEWLIVSDQPTDVTTFDEYGLRFEIEESFLDDKSNGFQLESSLIRSAEALSRLCLALAFATLFLVCQGTAVVESGQRRWVDPHWFRGSSYFKIGWRWVQRALVMGYALITRLRLSPLLDPEPAIASQKQAQARSPLRFATVHVEVFSPYAASSP
jgi:hypothetical protein